MQMKNKLFAKIRLLKVSKWTTFFVGSVLLTSGCKSTYQYLEVASPEEYAIKPTKITDETQTPVIGNRHTSLGWGSGQSPKLGWETGRRIAISPDGTELAYIGLTNDQLNIMVKKPTLNSPSTQRTFRRALKLWWGPDNQIYFNDNTGNNSSIGSVDAKKGSLVRQLTSNNNDWDPAVSNNGEMLYFQRIENNNRYIWGLNLKTGELTNCTQGFEPVPYGDDPYTILCTRNSSKGNSEIWMIDLKNGNETLLLSNIDKGFTSPAVSPDGEWILVVGNSLSSLSHQQNTDIYAVRKDGSNLTQITYHPEIDCSPIWSPDGNYIYFISSRANKDRKFSVWRIENPLK